MPAIKFTGTTPTVNLGVRNWSEDIGKQAGLVSWATLREGRTTVANGRITGVAPRAGTAGLVAAPSTVGPQPITVGGMSGANFTNGELNGLMLQTTVQRASVGIVVIAHIDTAEPQNRTMLGLYGAGDNNRIWKDMAGLYSWRAGSTDYAKQAIGFNGLGFLLMIADQGAAGAVALRLRSQTAISPVTTGTLTSTVPATVTPVFGQDEIADGHANAAPNASQAWGNNIMETLVFNGPILTNPDRLALIDAYFTTVYGGFVA